MSSVSLLLLVLLNNISQALLTSPCDLPPLVELQSAIYRYPFLIRVQPIFLSESVEKARQPMQTGKVLVREVIKTPSFQSSLVKMNDTILIRINLEMSRSLDDSCWQLLRSSNVDLILFLNETRTRNEFHLPYPPVESTVRVRENIDAVLSHETFSPQVIVKARLEKAVLSQEYSLQCNARGNPIPRLSWTKRRNKTVQALPSAKQCPKSCRVYSIQNKYHSVLHFQSLTSNDTGMYICHAENAINTTTASVELHVEETIETPRSETNVTCTSLNLCHHRGQCLLVDDQWKCLCHHRFFGERCETDYDEIIEKRDNAILLFKSRCLAGGILVSIVLSLVFVILMSYSLARRRPKKSLTPSTPMINGTKRSTSRSLEQDNHSSIVHWINHRAIFVQESLSEVDDELHSTSRRSDQIDQQEFPVTLCHSEEFNRRKRASPLTFSDDCLELYPSDIQSEFIRPLTIRTDTPEGYVRYVSTQPHFFLSNTIDQ